MSDGPQPGIVLVPLAPGFEEIEAVVIIDVLRRAGIEVCVAGLQPGPVTGAHGIQLGTDCALSAVDPAGLVMLVLPGGMPGATNLQQDARILALVRELESSGRTVAAICAAPLVLAAAGVLRGRRVTAYPGVLEKFVGTELVGAGLVGRGVVEPLRVVRCGPVVTSQGVGTALEFALELVSELVGPAKARTLRSALLVD